MVFHFEKKKKKKKIYTHTHIYIYIDWLIDCSQLILILGHQQDKSFFLRVSKIVFKSWYSIKEVMKNEVMV